MILLKHSSFKSKIFPQGFSKSQAEVVPLLVPQPVMPVSTVSESGIIPKVQ